jgi:4-amino-4-deoxy-L-arabinose transferase-like glycosyltransferase
MMVRPFRLLDHPAALLGLAALALHLWVNGSYGYFRDELYFIICGRHPAWGYTDQPPLMPLIAAASDAAFHSLRGLRLVPALAAAATVALTASAAQMLGGRLYARWLAGLTVLASGTLPFWGVVVETDTLEPLAWLAVAICVIRAEKDQEPRWWLAAGAIGGIAFLAKYTVALYPVSIALGLLATPQRRVLAQWRPWAGVLVAVAIAAPNLLWQAANGCRSSPTPPRWRRPETFRSRRSRFSCRRSSRSGQPPPRSGSRASRLLASLRALRRTGGSR